MTKRHVRTAPGRAPAAAATRRSVLEGCLALLPAALAACGWGAETAAPQARQLAPVTIRYAGPITPSPSNTHGAAIVKIIEAFNALGTPIKVLAEDAQPLTTSVLAQAAAGNPPDAVHAHPRDYIPFVDGGALRELDTYLKKERRNAPDIIPAVLDYWTRDGRHFAMPDTMTVQAIYFNKALFDKNGLKTPDQYEREGKWTYDVYLDLARRITSGTGENKIWGAPWTPNTLDIQLSFIWSFGGDVWDKAVQNTLLDKKESLEAIQFQADLTGRLGVSPTTDEVRQLPRSVGGALAVERGGMEILTTDVIALLTPTTFPKGMAPMPRGPAGRMIRGAPIGAALLKDSKHHDAAWEYANFQSGPEAEQIMLDLHISVPWRKSRLGSPDYAKGLLPWENATFYAETMKQLRPTVYPNQFVEIRKLYAEAYDKVRGSQQTAQQAISAIKGQINDLLKPK